MLETMNSILTNWMNDHIGKNKPDQNHIDPNYAAFMIATNDDTALHSIERELGFGPHLETQYLEWMNNQIRVFRSFYCPVPIVLIYTADDSGNWVQVNVVDICKMGDTDFDHEIIQLYTQYLKYVSVLPRTLSSEE